MSPTLTVSPASPKVGDPITLTIVDAPRKSTPAVAEVDEPVQATNPDTGAIGKGVIVFPAIPAVPAKPFIVTDPNRTWTLKSDDGTTAVYTSTA